MALFVEKVLFPVVVALIVAIFGGKFPGVSDWTQRILLTLAVFFATWFVTYSWPKGFLRPSPQPPADGVVRAAAPSVPRVSRAESPALVNPVTANAGAGSGSTYTADRQTIINQAPGSVVNLPQIDDRVPELAGTWYRDVVATIYKTLDPDATISVGHWIDSPEGLRKVDIWIRGKIANKNSNILLKCIDTASGAPIDINTVDEFDSLLTDSAADEGFICSNTGFTQKALLKAARVNIGMLSVLKSDDDKFHAVAETQTVSELIKIEKCEADISPVNPEDLEYLKLHSFTLSDLYFAEKPVVNWIGDEVGKMASPDRLEKSVRYTFKEPVLMREKTHSFLVRGLTIRIEATKGLYTHKIIIESKAAIYDHLNHSVRTASGELKITPEDVRHWKPLEKDDSTEFEYPRISGGTNSATIRSAALVGRPKKDDTPSPDLNSLVEGREVLESCEW